MSSFSIILRNLRTSRELTQSELAKALNVANSTISMYESGLREPDYETKEAIADFFNISMEALHGKKEFEYKSPILTKDTTTFKVIGEIAAGYNGIAEESWDGEEIEIPNSYLKGSRENYFVLRVKGDSMFPDYQDGDCVLIQKQSSLDHSGQIGAIIYDGDSATLKRVEYAQDEDWMRLIPLNSLYPTKKIIGSDLEQCLVLGVPKLLIRKID